MARPRKTGLDYFPFDVNFFSDKKIKIVKARFGNDGVIIYLYLLCEIYKNGYYIVWDEDYKFIVADELNLSDGLIKQVLKFLVERSLLQSILLNSDTIITSPSIQRRFQEIAKTRKTPTSVLSELWLLSNEETQGCIKVISKQGFSKINPSLSEINSNKSEIYATKESKVKESKVKKNNTSTDVDPRNAFDYQSVVNAFNSICVSLPKVQKLTDARKKKIKALQHHLDSVSIEEYFNMIESSDFLSGRTGKWTGCNFDWTLNSTNIIKVIEGNYNDRQAKRASNVSYDIEELEKIDKLENF
jgi:hypothetical protein